MPKLILKVLRLIFAVPFCEHSFKAKMTYLENGRREFYITQFHMAFMSCEKWTCKEVYMQRFLRLPVLWWRILILTIILLRPKRLRQRKTERGREAEGGRESDSEIERERERKRKIHKDKQRDLQIDRQTYRDDRSRETDRERLRERVFIPRRSRALPLNTRRAIK